MNLILGPELFEQMTILAKAKHPQEACGLLAGRGVQATRFIPTENTLASETAYEMDPSQLASAFRSMRENGENLLAIIHSHPRGAAEPSRTDMERAFYPEVVHIIISLKDMNHPQIRGFMIAGGQSWEVELHAIV